MQREQGSNDAADLAQEAREWLAVVLCVMSSVAVHQRVAAIGGSTAGLLLSAGVSWLALGVWVQHRFMLARRRLATTRPLCECFESLTPLAKTLTSGAALLIASTALVAVSAAYV
jgi:hypothetical protein